MYIQKDFQIIFSLCVWQSKCFHFCLYHHLCLISFAPTWLPVSWPVIPLFKNIDLPKSALGLAEPLSQMCSPMIFNLPCIFWAWCNTANAGTAVLKMGICMMSNGLTLQTLPFLCRNKTGVKGCFYCDDTFSSQREKCFTLCILKCYFPFKTIQIRKNVNKSCLITWLV